MFGFHGGNIITVITQDQNVVEVWFWYQTVAKVTSYLMIIITNCAISVLF